jgi:hypothetical protein
VSYLRFTPDDYRTILQACCRLDPGSHHRPAFKRRLVEALAGTSSSLAKRIARLRASDVRLLHDHFRERTRPANPWHEFAPGELRALEDACAAAPFPVRFVRPFKRFLVDKFQEIWPDLARKISWLSGPQFERLYEQVNARTGRSW